MSGRTHARTYPERTCLGCRERAAKSDLLRIVRDGDRCVPDQRGTLPGRGAYVHPAPVCLDLAQRRRAFPRAFRVKGPLDTTALGRVLEDSSRQAAEPAADAATP